MKMHEILLPIVDLGLGFAIVAVIAVHIFLAMCL